MPKLQWELKKQSQTLMKFPMKSEKTSIAASKCSAGKIALLTFSTKLNVREPGTQTSRVISRCVQQSLFIAIWVCLKMSCTPKPNGFADHYPYEKWLAIIGNINPTFSGPKPYFSSNVNWPILPSLAYLSTALLGHDQTYLPLSGVGKCPMTWEYWTSPEIVAI